MPQNMQDYWLSESIKDKRFEDQYDLGKELGRGSTAVVYKCTVKGTDQAWAVKIIDKRVEHKTVLTEVGILLRLDHPNIVRMKEVYESLEYVYIILELVIGSELFERIVSQQFYSEEQAAIAVRDIITAVDYLHKHNVVHRDLKPENILYENLSPDSKLKIADFGLSTIVSNKVSLVTVCGTPGYCAPEVLKGEKYDKSCDMWSVGVIAYIMLSGYEPFYAENEALMFKNILKGQYTFDSPWWDEVSENAKDLIRKLLVVDPKKRLTSAAALKNVWVAGVANKKDHKEATVEKLKEFNARRKLKFATDTLMAVAGATKKMPLFSLFAQDTEDSVQEEMEVN
ncbi:calcium/calmodulin-dependent protein kinase type IV-like [Physella acuta]|uniref:calcium/calmodulin-dependent protein kinase type IV-like n=1 Tax=Physella acuta TaxID=109671 RepID=UPI0027DBA70F|nr:calcium/calmodulin-dependent protein kinase type IV-like [Physella acuta]XP_059139415.1 calcium/calmodulin-dependent protein kinase type IV-like [Physella acuta]XP_059139425.1 calcium/calmodulin-dependent protein kinase type IV-like [Physella acuta]